MTAAPLNNGLAKVRKLLPVKIREGRLIPADVVIEDKNGSVFCRVPHARNDAFARAEMIRDAMNEMA